MTQAAHIVQFFYEENHFHETSPNEISSQLHSILQNHEKIKQSQQIQLQSLKNLLSEGSNYLQKIKENQSRFIQSLALEVTKIVSQKIQADTSPQLKQYISNDFYNDVQSVSKRLHQNCIDSAEKETNKMNELIQQKISRLQDFVKQHKRDEVEMKNLIYKLEEFSRQNIIEIPVEMDVPKQIYEVPVEMLMEEDRDFYEIPVQMDLQRESCDISIQTDDLGASEIRIVEVPVEIKVIDNDFLVLNSQNYQQVNRGNNLFGSQIIQAKKQYEIPPQMHSLKDTVQNSINTVNGLKSQFLEMSVVQQYSQINEGNANQIQSQIKQVKPQIKYVEIPIIVEVEKIVQVPCQVIVQKIVEIPVFISACQEVIERKIKTLKKKEKKPVKASRLTYGNTQDSSLHSYVEGLIDFRMGPHSSYQRHQGSKAEQQQEQVEQTVYETRKIDFSQQECPFKHSKETVYVQTPIIEEKIVEKIVQIPVPIITEIQVPIVRIEDSPIVKKRFIQVPIVQEKIIEVPVVQEKIVEIPMVQQKIIEVPIFQEIIVQRIIEVPVIIQNFIYEPISLPLTFKTLNFQEKPSLWQSSNSAGFSSHTENHQDQVLVLQSGLKYQAQDQQNDEYRITLNSGMNSKLTERQICEVPVEVIVEKQVIVKEIVQKMVEVPVEIQKYIEVEVPVEIERVVERIVEKLVEVPIVMQKIVYVQVPVEIERIIQVPITIQKAVEAEVPIEIQRTIQRGIKVPIDLMHDREVLAENIVLNHENSVENEVLVEVTIAKQKETPIEIIQDNQVSQVMTEFIVQKAVPIRQIIQVPIEIIVQKQVEKIVIIKEIIEVPYEIIVEKIIEKPVIIQRIIEVPIFQQKIVELPIILENNHDITQLNGFLGSDEPVMLESSPVFLDKEQNIQQKALEASPSDKNLINLKIGKIVSETRQENFMSYEQSSHHVIERQIIEVPVQVFVQRIIEVPVVIERILQVPVVTERVVKVEIPVEIEKIVEVGKIVYIDRVIQVPIEVFIDRQVPVEIIVEKQTIVERWIEVPIEVIVQKQLIHETPVIIRQVVEVPCQVIIEKQVQIPVIIQRIVNQYVEIPCEVIIEKFVEIPVLIQETAQQPLNTQTFTIQNENQINHQQVNDTQQTLQTGFNIDNYQAQSQVQKFQTFPVIFQQHIGLNQIVEIPTEIYIEVPTTVYVEKIIEKPVEVIVEKIVQVIKEVPIKIYVDRITEVPVEIIVEKVTEVPVEIRTITEVPVQVIVQRLVQVPIQIQTRADEDIETINTKIIEVAIEKIVEVPIQVMVEKIVQIEVQRIVEVPVQVFIEVEKEVKVFIKEYIQVPVQVIVEKPIETIIQKIIYLERPTIDKLETVQIVQNDDNNLMILQERADMTENQQQKLFLLENGHYRNETLTLHNFKEPVTVSEEIERITQVPIQVYIQKIVQVPKIQQKIVEIVRYIDREVRITEEKIIEIEKIVEVPVEVFIEKTIEVIVEKIIEVPVQVFVDRYVEVPIKVTVQKPVQVVIERPIEIIIQKIVEVFVDRVIEVPVEVFLDRNSLSAQQSSQENLNIASLQQSPNQYARMDEEIQLLENTPLTNPFDDMKNQIIQIPVEIETIVEKIIEVPVEIVTIVQKIVQVPVEIQKVIQKMVQVPVYISDQRNLEVLEVPIQLECVSNEIVEVPVQIEVERIVQVPIEILVEKIVQIPVEIHIEKIVQVPVEIEKIVQKIVKVPVYMQNQNQLQAIEVPVEIQRIVQRVIEVPVQIEKIIQVPVIIQKRVQVPVQNILYERQIIEIPVEIEKIVYVDRIVYEQVFIQVPVEVEVQKIVQIPVTIDSSKKLEYLSSEMLNTACNQHYFSSDQLIENPLKLQSGSPMHLATNQPYKINKDNSISRDLACQNLDQNYYPERPQIVQVPIEIIVEKIFEVPVQVVVERTVEILVQIEKIVEVPVQVIIQKIIQVPVQIEKIVEVPIEVIIEKHIQVPIEISTQNIDTARVQVPIQVIVEKIVEVPVEIEQKEQKLIQVPVIIEQTVEVPIILQNISEKDSERYTYRKIHSFIDVALDEVSTQQRDMVLNYLREKYSSFFEEQRVFYEIPVELHMQDSEQSPVEQEKTIYEIPVEIHLVPEQSEELLLENSNQDSIEVKDQYFSHKIHETAMLQTDQRKKLDQILIVQGDSITHNEQQDFQLPRKLQGSLQQQEFDHEGNPMLTINQIMINRQNDSSLGSDEKEFRNQMKNLEVSDIKSQLHQENNLFGSINAFMGRQDYGLSPRIHLDLRADTSSFDCGDHTAKQIMKIDNSHYLDPKHTHGIMPILTQNSEEISASNDNLSRIHQNIIIDDHQFEQIQKLRNELNYLHEDNESNKKQLLELTNKNHQLQTDLQNKNLQVECLASRILTFSMQKENEILTFKSQKNQVQGLMQKIQSQNDQLNRRVEQIKNKYMRLQEKHENTVSQLNQFKVKYNAQIQLLTNELYEKKTLLKEIKTEEQQIKNFYENELSVITHELKSFKNQIQKLEEEISKKQTLIEKLNQSHEDLRIKLCQTLAGKSSPENTMPYMYEQEFMRIREKFEIESKEKEQKIIELTFIIENLEEDLQRQAKNFKEVEAQLIIAEKNYEKLLMINEKDKTDNQLKLYQLQTKLNEVVMSVQEENDELKDKNNEKNIIIQHLRKQLMQFGQRQQLLLSSGTPSDSVRQNVPPTSKKQSEISGVSAMLKIEHVTTNTRSHKKLSNNAFYIQKLQSMVLKYEQIINSHQEMISQLQERVYEYLKDALQKEQQAQSLYTKLYEYENTINSILVEKITMELENKRLKKVIIQAEKKLELLGNQLIKVARESIDYRGEDDDEFQQEEAEE